MKSNNLYCEVPLPWEERKKRPKHPRCRRKRRGSGLRGWRDWNPQKGYPPLGQSRRIKTISQAEKHQMQKEMAIGSNQSSSKNTSQASNPKMTARVRNPRTTSFPLVFSSLFFLLLYAIDHFLFIRYKYNKCKLFLQVKFEKCFKRSFILSNQNPYSPT